MKRLMVGFVSVIAMLLTVACDAQDKGARTTVTPGATVGGTTAPGGGSMMVRVPSDAQFVLTLNGKNEITVIDPSGKQATQCQICDPDKAGGCRESKLPRCLIKTNVTDILSFNVIRHTVNPTCITIEKYGTVYTIPAGCAG